MRPSLADTAFAFDGSAVSYGQVVLAAVVWGEWAQLEHEAELGVLYAERARPDPGALAEDDLHSALIGWRRERKLLSADDYNAWLAERGLTLEDMSGYLSRAVAREQASQTPAGVSDDAAEDAGDPARIAEIVYPEAILSGRLRVWAERMARHRAAARALRARGTEIPTVSFPEAEELVASALRAPATGLGDVPTERLRAWAAELTELLRSWDALGEQVAGEESIVRCLSGHRLDWQRLGWEEVVFAREDVAHEAALWVREEGLALSAVAEQAGIHCTVRAAYSYEAGALSRTLGGVRPGELHGPVASESGWLLVHLRERVLPSAADPELRGRAREELLDDALAPHLAGRVEWHARF